MDSKYMDSKVHSSTDSSKASKEHTSATDPIQIVLQNGISTIHWGQVYDVLSELAAKPPQMGSEDEDAIHFPATLTATQRKTVHLMAGRLFLEHDSVGVDPNRHIVVKRKKTAPKVAEESPQPKEAKKSKDQFDKIPHGVSEIIPGFMYLGSMRDAYDKDQLFDKKIKYILNCAKETKNYHMQSNLFVYHNANLMDVEDQVMLWDPVIEFIERAKTDNASILVHCVIGKSRSAAVVLAYLMTSHKMTLKEAYYHVKERRSLIQPNEGFMQQLIQLEFSIHQQNTMAKGDWVPLMLTKQEPKKPKPSNAQIEENANIIIKKYLTDEFLYNVVEKICEGSFEKKRLGAFITSTSNLLGEVQEVVQELQEKGIKLKDIGRKIHERARDYYVAQMDKQAKSLS